MDTKLLERLMGELYIEREDIVLAYLKFDDKSYLTYIDCYRVILKFFHENREIIDLSTFISSRKKIAEYPVLSYGYNYLDFLNGLKYAIEIRDIELNRKGNTYYLECKRFDY